MRIHLMSGWLLIMVIGVSLQAEDQPAATAPATRPSMPLASVKRLVNQLASANYPDRDSARIELMGLKRTDLPVLREAVKQSLPLEPSQLAVLRDIVTQVYLAGDIYEVMDGDLGFLGVSLPSPTRAEDRGLFALERGVAIISRVPGFCAYRMLQNGDVLIAMTAGGRTVAFNTPEDLQDAVMSIRAGQSITFDVLRQGEIVKVVVTLDARPRGLQNQGIAQQIWLQEFNARRADAVEELWQRDFAPLLAEKIG